MRILHLSVLILILQSPLLMGQDPPVDSLFEDPEDKIADPNDKVTQADLAGRNLRFFESVQADGYYIVGWEKDSSEPVQSPYNALSFRFGTDARLDRNIRAYASFEITYPKTDETEDNVYNPYEDLVPTSSELTFSNLDVEEMFIDYTLADWLFLRAGRENLTWGQGRIFNPGDFAGALSSGLGVKMATALLGFNITLMAMKNDGYFNLKDEDLTGLDTLGLAGKADGSWWGFSGGVSGFHHNNVGDKVGGFLKTTLWGFDLFTEGLIERQWVDSQPSGDLIPSVLAGFYKEFGTKNPWLKLQVEYLASGRGASQSLMVIPETFVDWSDQSVGVGATSDFFSFLKTKPTLSWLHSFKDQSGQFLFGMTNTSFPHLDLSAGLLWLYGDENGRYSSESGNPDPLGRRLMLTFKATFQFDIDN